ncbi:hypothetical protein Agub_g9739 [Astrephomene gubernaculifera]|uniref:Uncharacterized protein n=1 Tax=Astrephomene gubernaculifera TaxID=47775 RepID=A0AAD3DTX6_9CHLO|nr:hypothetical protein Agub_g9739 [Astrephomene gubernaculifera]
MDDDEDTLSSMSGDYGVDILPSSSDDEEDEDEVVLEQADNEDADDAESEEGHAMLGGRATGRLFGRLPDSYLQGTGDAPNALGLVQAPAREDAHAQAEEESTLASCMQSPGLRARRPLIGTASTHDGERQGMSLYDALKSLAARQRQQGLGMGENGGGGTTAAVAAAAAAAAAAGPFGRGIGGGMGAVYGGGGTAGYGGAYGGGSCSGGGGLRPAAATGPLGLGGLSPRQKPLRQRISVWRMSTPLTRSLPSFCARCARAN